MLLSIDQRQSEVLREILDSQLRELRRESDHTDTREYRDYLHARTQIIESLLAKFSVEESRATL